MLRNMCSRNASGTWPLFFRVFSNREAPVGEGPAHYKEL